MGLAKLLMAASLMLAACPAWAQADTRLPIIDMHLHARKADYMGPNPPSMCAPFEMMPRWDNSLPGEESFTFGTMPPCKVPILPARRSRLGAAGGHPLHAWLPELYRGPRPRRSGRDLGDGSLTSREHHQASLKLPAVQEAVARARPHITGFGERFETVPVGGNGLGGADRS